MNSRQEVPATCPPLLKQLIMAAGTKTLAAQAMGIHGPDMSSLIHGRTTLSEARKAQALKALDALARRDDQADTALAISARSKYASGIVIQKGVPMPTGKGHKGTYVATPLIRTLEKMRVGDSFELPAAKDTIHRLRTNVLNAVNYQRKREPEKWKSYKLTSAITASGVRFWRAA